MLMSVWKKFVKNTKSSCLGQTFLEDFKGTYMDRLQANCKWTSNALLTNFKQTSCSLQELVESTIILFHLS